MYSCDPHNMSLLFELSAISIGQGYWKFEGFSFPTIQELVEYQHSSGKPVTKRSRALLKTPISQSRQPKMAEVGAEIYTLLLKEG